MSDAGSENGEKGDILPPIGIYIGERNADGVRHGQGKNTYPNGDIFEGQYQNGKRHGNGVYTFAGGKGRYTGEYVGGLKHGKGTFLYPDGSRYEGDFVSGKRHGVGNYTYPNGDHYAGEWHADLRNGKGVYTYAGSNSKKSGVWAEGVLTGEGEIIHADHKLSAVFSSNDRIEVPAKITFLSTGYSSVIKDPMLIDQPAAPSVEI